MGLLDGDIARAVAAGFRGKLLRGYIRRRAATTTDANNDPVPGPARDYRVEGVVDSFSAYTRAAANIPTENMRVTLIAGLCKAEPVTGDYLYMRRSWWKLLQRTDDPAEATLVFEAAPANEP